MKSFAVLRYVLLATAAATAATAQADDPGGLWNAKWNMTLEQVRTAVVGAAPVNPPVRSFWTVGRLKAPTTINGYPFDLLYEFNPQIDRFCAATLTPGAGIARPDLFYSIKQALLERYGKPIDEDTTEQSSAIGTPYFEKVVLWTLPATTIRLTWLEMGGVGGSYVSVRYSARGADLPM